MSKISWDDDGSRLYETGCDRGVLFKKNGSTYSSGVAFNGLTSVSDSPSGAEANKVYADNMNYLTLYSVEEFGGSIEAYDSPDEFDECDGLLEVAPGVLIAQQKRVGFGFSYRSLIGNDEVGSDYGYKIHLWWNCMATPSEHSHSTVNDSPEAETQSWEVTTTPINVDGYKPISNMTIDSTRVDAALLAAFEKILYGSDNSDSTLMSPAEVIAFFKNGITLTLSEDTATVAVSSTVTVTATVTPATATVSWSSSDTDVATVSNGVITGVGAGTATITASCGSVSATCEVTVTA